jgi:hypothetical protein
MEPYRSLPHSQVRAICASSIQSTPVHPTFWRSILILSSHLCLGLASGFFPSGFSTITLCTPPLYPKRATRPAYLIFSILAPLPFVQKMYIFVSFMYAVIHCLVESSWNVMAHGDAREGKWRKNWRMEWVASTLYTTSKHDVSSITTADAHTSAASSRLNWRPRRFKWTRPFRRKTKSGFCACAITFQTQSTAIAGHWMINRPSF